MTAARAYLAFALAFVLTFTGQSMALARTAPDPAGQMVLCTGSGPVTVLLDAEGQPTGAVHVCPDCTLSLLAAVAETGARWARATNWRLAHSIDFYMEFEGE